MRQRKCKDCGCDITQRYIAAKRCIDCAVKRQQRLANRRRQRRQCRENKRVRNRKLKLSPRQKMKINLARRDALAPKPKTEIIERNGIIIERRGTVPARANAVGIIKHT